MDSCQLRAAWINLLSLPSGKLGKRSQTLGPTKSLACRCHFKVVMARQRHTELINQRCFTDMPGSFTQARWRTFNIRNENRRRVSTCSQVDDQDDVDERSNGDDSELLDSLQKAKQRQRMAVLLEIEGVLTDIHRRANREAFNSVFKELDLDCANWSEPVYKDLYRMGGGKEERMVQLFFDRIGWPLAVATSERKAFIKRCLDGKKTHLEGFIEAGRLPFRPGVEEFLLEAASEGVILVALGVSSRIGFEATRKLVAGLGPTIQVLSEDDVKDSVYAQVAAGKGALAGADNMLASKLTEAVYAEKQRLAEMVAEKLKLTVDLDTGEKSQETVLTLRAAAEKAATPVGRCILVAGSHAGVQAAARISMPCVVMKSSFTAGAEFPGSLATYVDYGPGSGLTLAKLRRCLERFHS